MIKIILCAFKIPLFYAQQEKEQAKNTDVFLDPNHTHFILVDDGSEGHFGKEIEFRAHLEAELRKGRSLKHYENRRILRKRLTRTSSLAGYQPSDEEEESNDEESSNESVPMILIVVQGGPNTLITVEESLKQSVPVLVLAVNIHFIMIFFSIFALSKSFFLKDSKGCADVIANACILVKPE